MAISRRKAEAPVVHEFTGFYSDGRFGRSGVPFHNEVDQWVRWMLGHVNDRYWTPQMIIADLRNRSQAIRDVIPDQSKAQWFSLDRYWQWPMADASSSLMRCIKDHGKGYPMWLNDENQWSRRCDIAETIHGHERRPIGPGDKETILNTLMEGLSS